jgi:hypothetical protein
LSYDFLNYCVVVLAHDVHTDWRDLLVTGVQRFDELKESKVELVRAGRKRNLKHAENWASKAFDNCHLCKDLTVEKSIRDLS